MPPIYDYKCKAVTTEGVVCGHEFEVFYSSPSKVAEEEPSEVCPKCKTTEKERTPPKKTSFILKGRWYKNGY